MDNVITADMALWAHHVRLEANDARHANSDNPHATADEAKQSVEFAAALGHFLFVLPSRVRRGLEAAGVEVGADAVLAGSGEFTAGDDGITVSR
jgi:hypothetical protein